jgi:hypothetical protein
MQAGTKVNDMGASRTRKFLEADAVANAEGNTDLSDMARTVRSNGVCVAGMYKNVQPRNLGGPIFSDDVGKCSQSRLEGCTDGRWEVRLPHSAEEAG